MKIGNYVGIILRFAVMVRYYRGIILVSPHGSSVMSGIKTISLKSKRFTSILDKPLLVIEKKIALGIIKLTNMREINLRDFVRLRPQHRISDAERKKWWNGKKKLYAYDIIVVKKFAHGRPVDYPVGVQGFVLPENITFLRAKKKK